MPSVIHQIEKIRDYYEYEEKDLEKALKKAKQLKAKLIVNNSTIYRRTKFFIDAWKKHKFSTNNIYHYDLGGVKWESDVLSIDLNDLFHEWEIKRTLNDFKADIQFKKDKHYLVSNGSGPSYFSYVCPPNIIREQDIPEELEYAGLYHVKGQSLIKIRDPKQLHNRPIEPEVWEGFAKRLYQRK